MSSRKKFVFAIILIILAISSNFMFSYAAKTQNELEAEKNDIENKINKTEEELNEIQANLSSTLSQIEKMIGEISSYEDEIENLNDQIVQVEQQIEVAKSELSQAEANYAKQKESLQKRLVAVYKNGETKYLDVLLSSANILDFISKYYVVEQMAEYDSLLLEKMETNKLNIDIAKQTLEKSGEQLVSLKTSKEVTAKALKDAQAVKEEYANTLSAEEQATQQELEQYKEEQTKITQQLREAERKYSSEIANLGGTGTFQRPVASGGITATMYYSSGRYHGALDYGVPVGTTIYAAADGVVLSAGWGGANSYGNYICLQHGDGLRTYYAHGNGTFYVSSGDTVSKGQAIMLSGNTGKSTGPHLHFEVRVYPYSWGDCRVDPRNYL